MEKDSGLEKVTKWFESNLKWILVVSAVLALVLPWGLTRPAFSSYFALPDGVGSTIGGISQTILGVVTIILIYLTYSSQKEELKKLSSFNESGITSSTFMNSINIKHQMISSTRLEDRDRKEIRGIYTYMHIASLLREICIKEFFEKKTIEIYKEMIRSNDPNNSLLFTFFKSHINHKKFENKPYLDYFLENTYGTEVLMLVNQTNNLVGQILSTSSPEYQRSYFAILSSSYSIAEKELLYFYTNCKNCPQNLIELTRHSFFDEVKGNERVIEFGKFKHELTNINN